MKYKLTQSWDSTSEKGPKIQILNSQVESSQRPHLTSLLPPEMTAFFTWILQGLLANTVCPLLNARYLPAFGNLGSSERSRMQALPWRQLSLVGKMVTTQGGQHSSGRRCYRGLRPETQFTLRTEEWERWGQKLHRWCDSQTGFRKTSRRSSSI